MGVALRELIVSREIEFSDLQNKVLAVDAYNQLYQYLTTIRSTDGSLLKDSHGNITSHLVGLFSRNSSLIQKGLKLIFVFDGIAPKLKYAEIERRIEAKKEAQARYDLAVDEEDVEGMKKYAGRTARLTKDMVEESKLLLTNMGIPWVQALSEADAQIAHMAKSGVAFACVSQDFDALLHGSPRIVRNLSIAGKKKKANALSYDIVKPEMIMLEENLKALGVSQDQLIALGILVGPDYNPGGVKGIGPKKALALVKKHSDNLPAIFEEAGFEKSSNVHWQEIFDVIKKMPVSNEYELKWKSADKEKLLDLLYIQHDFSKDRILKTVEDLEKFQKSNSQQGLGSFF